MCEEQHWLSRTELLIGAEGVARLAKARVAVLGLGGVGSAAAEALGRAGVGHLLLCDHDTISLTNLNRQLIATRPVIGQSKAQEVRARLLQINPDGDFSAVERFYLPEECQFLYDWAPDLVIDAIDTVTAKLHLAQECQTRDIPMLASMGTGNRLDPGRLRIGDISETANGCGCGLARVIRKELKKRGVYKLTVCYSTEQPMAVTAPGDHGRHPPGSIAFVPPVAGYLLAAQAVRDLLAK